MRVAEHPVAQERSMGVDLRRAVQAATGVVEVHLIVNVEPAAAALALAWASISGISRNSGGQARVTSMPKRGIMRIRLCGTDRGRT